MKIVSACMIGVGLLLATAGPASTSDVAYLYGTVTTVDGEEYTGELRWGKEEAFWDDIFNSTKIENPNLDYLDDETLEDLEDTHRGWWERTFSDSRRSHTHVFQIRFGDIRSIHIIDGKEVDVELKDGSKLALEGGSNDIGAKITVLDPEVGKMRFNWDRVRRIDFKATPSTLDDKLGQPLFGTVETRHGEFSGLIQWDHDEALSTDVLDGESRDGDVKIDFGDIKSIEKDGRGSLVVLHSGREMELHGSNDVDKDNRGVIIKDPAIGKIKVGWRDFERVTFTDRPPVEQLGYDAYVKPREISGRVLTQDGDSYRGRIVYDLDEAWDYEMLNGSIDDTEFLIPFRLVASVEPKGRHRAIIELRGGQTFTLEDGQDVSKRNTGLLIFADSGDPDYVAWRDIDAVVFE